MAGYANRTVTLTFEDLTEEGDEPIRVTLRNPKIMPVDALVPADLDQDEKNALSRWYPVIAKLLVDWHVYDPTSDAAGDQPLLVEPTVENVAKLPRVIMNEITDVIVDALGISKAAGAGA